MSFRLNDTILKRGRGGFSAFEAMVPVMDALGVQGEIMAPFLGVHSLSCMVNTGAPSGMGPVASEGDFPLGGWRESKHRGLPPGPRGQRGQRATLIYFIVSTNP